MTPELPKDPDDLVRYFAAAVAELCTQGLIYARQDDPHLYAQVHQHIAAGDARLQLRCDFGGVPRTTLYAINDEGEPVAVLFEVVGVARAGSARRLN